MHLHPEEKSRGPHQPTGCPRHTIRPPRARGTHVGVGDGGGRLGRDRGQHGRGAVEGGGLPRGPPFLGSSFAAREGLSSINRPTDDPEQWWPLTPAAPGSYPRPAPLGSCSGDTCWPPGSPRPTEASGRQKGSSSGWGWRRRLSYFLQEAIWPLYQSLKTLGFVLPTGLTPPVSHHIGDRGHQPPSPSFLQVSSPCSAGRLPRPCPKPQLLSMASCGHVPCSSQLL